MTLVEYCFISSVLTDGGIFLLDRLNVPTIVVFLTFSFSANLQEVKRSTIHSETGCEFGRCSCLPRYGNPFNKYFELTSAKNQNLIPNLSHLFAIY